MYERGKRGDEERKKEKTTRTYIPEGLRTLDIEFLLLQLHPRLFPYFKIEISQKGIRGRGRIREMQEVTYFIPLSISAWK